MSVDTLLRHEIEKLGKRFPHLKTAVTALLDAIERGAHDVHVVEKTVIEYRLTPEVEARLLSLAEEVRTLTAELAAAKGVGMPITAGEVNLIQVGIQTIVPFITSLVNAHHAAQAQAAGTPPTPPASSDDILTHLHNDGTAALAVENAVLAARGLPPVKVPTAVTSVTVHPGVILPPAPTTTGTA